jgi:hypothetical protein
MYLVLRRVLVPALLLAGVVSCGVPMQEPEDTPGAAASAFPEAPPPLVSDKTSALTTPLLALKAIWYVDPETSAVTYLQRDPATLLFVWSAPYRDLHPRHFHMVWAPINPMTPAQVAQLLDAGPVWMQLNVGGQVLIRIFPGGSGDYYTSSFTAGSFGCPAGSNCVDTAVNGSRLMALAGGASTALWNIEMTLWTATGTYYQSQGMGRLAGGGSYFSGRLGPTFKSDRCSSCHAMGSKTLIINDNVLHRQRLTEASIQETVTPRGTQLRCGSGCHNVAGAVPGHTFAETEWMIPKFDMNINWSTMTVAQICARVKANLPTDAATQHHFFEDARIGWAVNDGRTPGGTTLPKAPPGSFAEFTRIINAWITSGRPCP